MHPSKNDADQWNQNPPNPNVNVYTNPCNPSHPFRQPGQPETHIHHPNYPHSHIQQQQQQQHHQEHQHLLHYHHHGTYEYNQGFNHVHNTYEHYIPHQSIKPQALPQHYQYRIRNEVQHSGYHQNINQRSHIDSLEKRSQFLRLITFIYSGILGPKCNHDIKLGSEGFNSSIQESATQGQSSSNRSSRGRSFFNPVIPSISLENYLHRIVKHTNVSDECLILALIYVDHLVKRCPDFQICHHTIHRLMLSSIVLAIKFHSDFFRYNSYYATVGGISKEEMNFLELEFLYMINFSLRVKPDDYEKYKREIFSFWPSITNTVTPQTIPNSTHHNHSNFMDPETLNSSLVHSQLFPNPNVQSIEPHSSSILYNDTTLHSNLSQNPLPHSDSENISQSSMMNNESGSHHQPQKQNLKPSYIQDTTQEMKQYYAVQYMEKNYKKPMQITHTRLKSYQEYFDQETTNEQMPNL